MHILWLSFLEGIGLILSPCILPILPIVLATGIQGGKSRPYGIILGFILNFILFTLLSRKLLGLFHIDQAVLQDISFYLLVAFGIILFSDTLSEKFSAWVQNFASFGEAIANKSSFFKSQGFWSGVLLGAVIALIWTPCAGPIMAAVLVQSLQETTDFQATLTLFCFGVGVAIPMLIITLLGNRILSAQKALIPYLGTIRKIMAIIIIVTMLMIKFDFWTKVFIRFEPSRVSSVILPGDHLLKGIKQPYEPPSFEGLTYWMNSEPLNLKKLKQGGKVVLIDFWTYSCINCVRTLPYLKDWHEKYADKGLVIIGIHAPEFEFEKNDENVMKAVQADGIKYPVALDNDLKTWKLFKNEYWPAHYLIDKAGLVVYTHFGEGEYDITENNIRFLLGLKEMEGAAKSLSTSEAKTNMALSISPETYLGYARGSNFQSPEKILANQSIDFTYPSMLERNSWALQGAWVVSNERIVAQKSGSSLKYRFAAKKVYVVMSSVLPDQPVKVNVFLNGQPIGSHAGKDVHNNQVIIKNDTLYELVSLNEQQSGILEIEVESPGLAAYAFTFGS